MIVFDTDQTLIEGHFIDKLIANQRSKRELKMPETAEFDQFIRAREFAGVMKGLALRELLAIADSVPLVIDAREVIQDLKKSGYVVGLITETYDLVAGLIKNKVGADFSFGYQLEHSNGTLTGELKIPPFYYLNKQSLCDHSVCKTNTLQYVLSQYRIGINDTIVVGGSKNDVCMLQHGGIGVAFCSENPSLNSVAQKTIERPSMQELLDIVQ